MENKIEPERKTQLARDLGLHPRQVAFWFQNWRSRWKTKQLEREYDILKSSYDTLREEYDNLLKEKEKLRSEVCFYPTFSFPFWKGGFINYCFQKEVLLDKEEVSTHPEEVES